MGRLFSYEEIMEGRIPDQASFVRASDTFIEHGSDLIVRGSIDGIIVYGSVPAGRASLRSDFDTLIALPDNSDRSYNAALRLVQNVRSATNGLVPTSAIMYSRNDFETGNHPVDVYFWRHLAGRQRYYRGLDPASYMTFRSISAEAVIRNYFLQKKKKLTDTHGAENPTGGDMKGLQRMLELPFAATRKILQALCETGEMASISDNSADKTMLMAKGRQLYEEYGVRPGFDSLIATNAGYDETLAEAIASNMSRATYANRLQDIYRQLPLAIRWIKQIEDTLIPAVLGRLINPYTPSQGGRNDGAL